MNRVFSFFLLGQCPCFSPREEYIKVTEQALFMDFCLNIIRKKFASTWLSAGKDYWLLGGRPAGIAIISITL